jgi:polyhydroxyalkanoate synthase
MAQTSLTKDFLDLWVGTLKKAGGEEAKPIAEPEASDKRFKDPEWKDNPTFNFLQQAYLITSRWAEHLVEDA